MSSDQPFDDKYWNLAQACAWVKYRERQLVNDFSVADRNAYMALGMYLSMWPAGRQQHDSVEDSRRALEQCRIKSSGYRGVHVACAQIPLTYFHLLFENHEIIRADSAWTESLFLADLGLRIVNRTDSWNLLGGLQQTVIRHARTARLVLKRYEATLLLTDRKASTGFAALAA
jgi:hypothetical protein